MVLSGRSFTSMDRVATTARIVPLSLRKGVVAACFMLAAGAWAQPAGPDPARVLAELPGFDFSRLPPGAKKELAQVLTDEFDACGRPLTLLGSLKKGDACKHTRRVVNVAALLAADGTPAMEIINTISRYNGSFGPRRAALKPDERQCVGPRDAKVTLVEFSDFECPYCALARPMLEEFAKGHPTVRFCSMLFPLPAHANAVIAGKAALFARESGKFWAMHDALFENQGALSEPFIKDLAKKLGLDPAGLAKVYATDAYAAELTASRDAGRAAGVDSTPTLFLNGRKLTLPINLDTLAAAVDDESDWVAGNNAWPSN